MSFPSTSIESSIFSDSNYPNELINCFCKSIILLFQEIGKIDTMGKKSTVSTNLKNAKDLCQNMINNYPGNSKLIDIFQKIEEYILQNEPFKPCETTRLYDFNGEIMFTVINKKLFMSSMEKGQQSIMLDSQVVSISTNAENVVMSCENGCFYSISLDIMKITKDTLPYVYSQINVLPKSKNKYLGICEKRVHLICINQDMISTQIIEDMDNVDMISVSEELIACFSGNNLFIRQNDTIPSIIWSKTLKHKPNKIICIHDKVYTLSNNILKTYILNSMKSIDSKRVRNAWDGDEIVYIDYNFITVIGFKASDTHVLATYQKYSNGKLVTVWQNNAKVQDLKLEEDSLPFNMHDEILFRQIQIRSIKERL